MCINIKAFIDKSNFQFNSTEKARVVLILHGDKENKTSQEGRVSFLKKVSKNRNPGQKLIDHKFFSADLVCKLSLNLLMQKQLD